MPPSLDPSSSKENRYATTSSSGLGVPSKRKKELSRRLYGTSYVISLGEDQHIFERGDRLLIVGAGQLDLVAMGKSLVGSWARTDATYDCCPHPKPISSGIAQRARSLCCSASPASVQSFGLTLPLWFLDGEETVDVPNLLGGHDSHELTCLRYHWQRTQT